MIISQTAFSEDPNECVVLEHPTLGLGVLPTWDTKCILSSILEFEEVSPVKVPDGYLIWEKIIFFAPADVLAGSFNDPAITSFIQKNCIQDTRFRIETKDKNHPDLLQLPIYLDTPKGILKLVLKVIDLSKLGGRGLEDTVKMFGGKMSDKGLMDQYKTNMLYPYTEPNLQKDFVKYSKSDACILHWLRKKNEFRKNKLFQIQNLTPPQNEILTVGSLVAILLEKYLENYIGEFKAYEFFTSTQFGKTRKFTLRDLLEKSTVAYFAQQKESNKSVASLVQGGRAKNERPTDFYFEGAIADADMCGAYVEVQKKLEYAVGLPVSWGKHESDKRVVTLGQFLKKESQDFENRQWAITVSGDLSFNQTLIPSKVTDSIKINENYSEDNPKINADFRLYTRQIINGIVTSDVLEALNNVCSSKELSEILSLEVVSAVWHPKSKKCTTPEEWFEKTKAHTDKTGNRLEVKIVKGRQVTIDNRSTYWLAVPLNSFIKPYSDIRGHLKRKMRSFEKGSDKFLLFDSKQNQMKLIPNTAYGVIASPYFPVGSAVLANVITAAVRTALWCTQAAVGGFLSITDGTPYDLNSVRDWKDHKPSMNTISLWRNQSRLNRTATRYLNTKSLGTDAKWLVTEGRSNGDDRYTILTDGNVTIECKEGEWTYLDEKLKEHVQHFFRNGEPISILDSLTFEHKDVYVKAITHSQTNYQFHHVSGDKKTKVRGQKLKNTPYNNDTEASNMFPLFNDLENNPSEIIAQPPQTISQLLKCNLANEMLNNLSDNVVKTNNLEAGDSLEKKSQITIISLSMFHWQSDKQFQSWSKTNDKLKKESNWGIEQYFQNEDGTINYQLAVSTIQEKIDDGESWICKYSNKNPKEKVLSLHPFHSDYKKLDNLVEEEVEN
ncbi:MAG: hypothetical protein KME13_18550 [Myxacorys californica WJT36-NPBG1]|nr:hypothetical protein [Myxacorys californica WJT36-NPBG1]